MNSLSNNHVLGISMCVFFLNSAIQSDLSIYTRLQNNMLINISAMFSFMASLLSIAILQTFINFLKFWLFSSWCSMFFVFDAQHSQLSSTFRFYIVLNILITNFLYAIFVSLVLLFRYIFILILWLFNIKSEGIILYFLVAKSRRYFYLRLAPIYIEISTDFTKLHTEYLITKRQMVNSDDTSIEFCNRCRI